MLGLWRGILGELGDSGGLALILLGLQSDVWGIVEVRILQGLGPGCRGDVVQGRSREVKKKGGCVCRCADSSSIRRSGALAGAVWIST